MTAARPTAAGRALGFGFEQLVRRGLHGVWVRGTLPSGGCIWAANHHSWWDGFLAAAVLRQQRRPAALLMQADNLTQYRFLADAGVIATTQPRRALQAVRDGSVLVVFPESELLPPGRLGQVAAGAGWLARRAAAPLVPVAVRVIARGHQYSDAVIDLGPPCEPKELAAVLEMRLRALDDAILATEARTPPDGFAEVISGRPSWEDRIDSWSDRLGRIRSMARR